MEQGADAVRFSLLGAHGEIDDDELYRLYAYPPARPRPANRCVVRANAIASLDGGATTGGTSGGLGGAGDRRLFAVQRELADVVVVGAGTARAENYGGARMSVAQRQRRHARGQGEIPPVALVTRSGALEPDLGVLTGSEAKPLVLTCAAAAAAARIRVGTAAEVVDCSAADPGQVDLGTLLARLADRGLLRVLAEGGPSLLGAFIAAGLLDEICLTSAPVLVGGGAVRIAAGAGDTLTAMRRAHVLTDAEGYLYTRYVRVG
jgi:riboflavin biosynthesis pyrimidine reductase